MSNKKHKKRRNAAEQKHRAEHLNNGRKNTSAKDAEHVKNEMSCAECEALLTDYMLELTSEEDTKKVKRHLNACSQCRDVQKELERIESVLSHAELVSPPPDFMKNLHRRLVKEQPVYIFVWNQVKHSLRNAWEWTRHSVPLIPSVVRQWWNSAAFPALKSLAERIGGMPKTWQIGAPVLACVLVVAVISTGIFTHMRSANPSGSGNDQLAVTKSDVARSDENSQGEAVTAGVESLPDSAQQSADPSESPQSDANSENSEQTDNPFDESKEGGTAVSKENPDAVTANESVSDDSALQKAQNPDVVTGDNASIPETAAENAYDSGAITAYSADFNDEAPIVSAPMSAPTGAGGASGGASVRSAKQVAIPSGTMDVYTIKTSNLSQTLSSSGFAGKAIRENGKTVLILTRSEYNQLQNNIFSSGLQGNEDIKYSGSENLRNSYEWDGCFRVEITQR